MKILGHAYVATQALEGNAQLLIIGSLLPEMVPYIPNDIFEYQELHEGGQKLLTYLDKDYPLKRNLALGLLSHGVKFGADGFSQESEKLVKPAKIGFQIAQGRLHNYVGLGIDWLLVQNEPELVGKVQKTLKEINLEEIGHLLAEGFNKDEAKVKSMVETLFRKIYRPEDLESVAGLARIWARQAVGLPEKDRVDIAKAKKIIVTCAHLLEESWRDFMEKVVFRVSNNLRLV